MVSLHIDEGAPKDIVSNVRVYIHNLLCDICDIPNRNIVVLPFNTTIKDISIEEAKPIKELLDKLMESKDDLQ